MQSVPAFDEATLDAVAGALDLRAPNRDAIQTLAMRLSEHYAASQEPFEAVLDSATGVGKTFIMAGGIDYFAQLGLRNFAIIAPGQTILQKTIDQFTEGTSKSLADRLVVSPKPTVIHAGNFNTPMMRAVMDDPQRVKLYVFSVQSLIKPSTKVGRRTHEFHEGLGSEFYTYLDELGDLIVFADEHHCYYGPKFSQAVRDLTPLALVGLTGTPAKKTPPEQIIFRYPLLAAIADKLVKTPVVVGRRDERADDRTQLLDGARLLVAKQQTIVNYCDHNGGEAFNAVMLVNCKDIAHAEEVGALVESDQFMGGAFTGRVLVVHSNQSDEALAKLDAVEQPGNPTRVIVQVGMLKEGWDVRSVYVIASLRASLSEVLTEQTMGRGLRLPFGSYTGWQMLDTLDILAHDQYEKVLKKAQALQQDFIDYRTVITTTIAMDGQTKATVDQQSVGIDITTAEAGDQDGGSANGAIRVVDQDTREQEAEIAAKLLVMRPDAPQITVPVTEATPVVVPFSLSMITDVNPCRELGRKLSAAGNDVLQRRILGAAVITGADGLRRTQLSTPSAADNISSKVELLPLVEARDRVVTEVRQRRVIPGRPGEGEQVTRLINAVIEGAGDDAQELLSRFPSRIATEVALLVGEAATRAPKLQFTTSVAVVPFNPKPQNERPDPSGDLIGKFKARQPYTGWKRCMFDQTWFDSEPERHLAVIIDAEETVQAWARLLIGDLPILWNGAQNAYNPDFLVTTTDGDAWIVEVKSNRDANTADVVAKRQAALEWVNTVNADSATGRRWHYLLATETDLKTASGSWATFVSTCGA